MKSSHQRRYDPSNGLTELTNGLTEETKGLTSGLTNGLTSGLAISGTVFKAWTVLILSAVSKLEVTMSFSRWELLRS